MLQLSPASVAVIYACLALGVVYVPAFVLYYRRRNVAPICERMPMFAILATFSYLTHMSLTLFAIVHPMPCLPVFVALNYFGSMSTLAFTLRYLNLYLTYRLNRSKIFVSSAMPVLTKASAQIVPITSITSFDHWLLNNKWVLTWRFHLPYFLTTMALVTTFNVTVLVTPGAINSDECTRSPAISPYLQFWYLFWTSVLLVLAVMMRIVVDGFHIKWELTITYRTSMLLIIFWVIPPLNDFDQTQWPILAVMYFVVVQVICIVSIILPIRWSYQEFGQQLLPAMSVREIMEQPNMLDAFQQFLITEFCIENLYFLLAIQHLQRMKQNATAGVSVTEGPSPAYAWLSMVPNFRSDSQDVDDAISGAIREIYTTFCVHTSAFAINISAHELREIEKHLNDGDVTIFNSAASTIEKLLETNSLPRFLNSNLGRLSRFNS